MNPCFALIDCNNFFASCERIFRPDLKYRPIVVLSNNDGCVIARSQESKALGIKMGTPYFQIKAFLEQENVAVFSSNYTLYGDISSRVMRTIASIVPKIEVYSIDEAFVDFSGLTPERCQKLAIEIKETVKRNIGIDVCVGFSSTKTLAKLANNAAKKYPKTGGIVDLTKEITQQKLLKITSIKDIWGIGRRLSECLNEDGVKSAWDLRISDASQMARRYSVVLERTINELAGISCQSLESDVKAKQQIIYSRGFSRTIEHLQEMKRAVATYAEVASARLRSHGLIAKSLTLFINTNRFQNPVLYYNEATCHLAVSSNDTRVFVQQALRCLESIWKPGQHYVKAGIILRSLSEGVEQADLFVESQTDASLKLMHVIDKINQRYGDVMHLGAQGIDQSWQMRRDNLSPSYTTNWKALMRVD